MFRSIILLCALLPLSARAEESAAAQFGANFCQISLAGDLTPLEALLSPDLSALLQSATQRNADIAAAYPGDKPPLGDGVPWSSWPDYADGCAVIAVNHHATGTGIVIGYTFSDQPEANYEDTLVVIPDPTNSDRVVLDDIQFIDELTLREILRAVTESEV